MAPDQTSSVWASKEMLDDKPPSGQKSTSSTRSSISSLSSTSLESIGVVEEHGVDPEKGLSPQVSRTSGPALSRPITGASVATNATTDPAFEVDFEEGTGENPKEWSVWYRSVIILFTALSTLTVVMYSTSYASGIPGMMHSFDISDETIVVLGITTYLFGMAVGSVILAPLSEIYGRRPIYIISMVLFTVFVIPCGLAQNLETILIVRFIGAFCASAFVSNSPGTVNDIVSTEYMALAFSIWSLGPMNGPIVGPIVGGFVYQYLGWRWTNWVIMICAGVSIVMVILMKETYAPALLRAKAARLRKETGDSRWWTRYDEKKQFWPMMKENLSRPFVMAVMEPICIFWNLYIAVVYAFLYLCFVAWPIVFTEQRRWSPGFSGLAYVGLAIGNVITIACEPLIRRFILLHKPDPATGKPPPESMISVVCIAAILVPAGEFWFAWTSRPGTHWAFPIASGIPFGAGNVAIFIYSCNYLVGCYGIYAASALAGNSVLRSVVGGTLPLAGPKMYRAMGADWAGTLLGGMEVLLIPIPFVFYWYGGRIRGKSRLIREMRKDQERLEGKKRKAEEREAMRLADVEKDGIMRAKEEV